MTEQEYMVSLFKEKFGDYAEEKLVLYGISSNTQTILEAFPKFDIVGLMDGYKTGEMLYGKKILSCDEVVAAGVKKIIIVARANSTKIICRRIADFCRNNRIALYDINGNDLLFKSETSYSDEPYFKVSSDSLKKAIMEHEVISFDIFDTLLMRKVMLPEDVFTIVESHKRGIDDFANQRVMAERVLNRAGVPTIAEIYKFIADNTGVSAEIADEYMAEELTVERAVLVVRREMVDIYRFALENGKKVCLISDMYMSKATIADILSEFGITGYADLFVSSEYQTGKTQQLFQIFKDKHQAESYLHIGDNIDADVTFAKMNGIDTFHIYSALDMLRASAMANILLGAVDLNERLLTGRIIAELFNSPFALYNSKGRVKISSGREMAIFIAPLLSAFVLWLAEQVKGNFDRVFWTARDGFLFKTMYDKLSEHYVKVGQILPRGDYFLTSRFSGISANLKSDEDILYAAKIAFDGTPAELLEKRFYLDKAVILAQQPNETIETYILKHRDQIKLRSAELRSNYNNYVRRLELKAEDKIAFFDFVSSGTCQMCMSDILQQSLTGFYFINFSDDYTKKRALNIKSFMEKGFLYELQSYLSKNYLLIESLIVSQQATLKSFDEDGNPLYIQDSRSASEKAYLADFQQAVMEFFAGYLDLYSLNSEALVRKEFVDTIFSLVQERYTIIENCPFESQNSKDEFCNREYKMVDVFK